MKGSIGLKTLMMMSSLLLFAGKFGYSKEIEPQIQYFVQDKYLQNLPSAYAELTPEEKETKWGMEYQIGRGFAHHLDLYRAITAFRRAEILLPEEMEKEKRELEYQILLSYYLGRRYQDVEKTFSRSGLASTPIDFPPFHDLLVILYDTYLQLEEKEKREQILAILQSHFPKTAQDLMVYTSLTKADFPALQQNNSKEIQKFLRDYENQKKSSQLAIILNGILPGAGYLYLGQLPTAITAILVNALFIFATIYFFRRRPIAVAIIFLGFEIGWYFGGIQGGALQTKLYNERVYEQLAKPIMNKNDLFPIYQLEYGF